MKKNETEWEFPSLKWIHEAREAHYERTRNLPLEAWMKPADPKEALTACKRLGLKVKLAPRRASTDARRGGGAR